MVIHISWGEGSGHANIDLERFFPTTLERTKKLFKLILLDATFDDTMLLTYFQTRQGYCVRESDRYKLIGDQYLWDAKSFADAVAKSQGHKEFLRLKHNGINRLKLATKFSRDAAFFDRCQALYRSNVIEKRWF